MAGIHPLISLLPLQSTCPLRTRSQPLLIPNAFPGVLVLHRDTSQESPLTGEHPTSAYGPPSAFPTLSTGYSSPHLASLFHLAATSKVPSSGAWPDSQPSVLIIARLCPLAVGDLPLRCPRATRQVRPPRPQGFDPAADPLLCDKLFRLADARSPLEFSLPRVLLRTP
jgi:hypothetical protein